MKLITRQSFDFDIVNNTVDLSKSHILSKYFDFDKTFSDAYKWLFGQIGHDKFIWCYVEDSHDIRSHGDEHVLWTLEVPDSECIKISETVWHMVLNKMPFFECADDIDDKEYDRLYDLYDEVKDQTWKDNIFKVEDPNDMQVLIKSPVYEKYVINKRWQCELDYSFLESGIENQFFDTKELAERRLEVVSSALRGRNKPFKYEFSSNETGFGLKIKWSEDK